MIDAGINRDADKKIYGGAGAIKKRVYQTDKIACGGKSTSLSVTLAERSFVYLVKKQ